mmetsp:Transcript_12817/g.31147  ORF Transcript_12817/g.31147 Transcript_12817/m.31147 type:complete len:204 (+) Transcript_12817:757-1368(+)
MGTPNSSSSKSSSSVAPSPPSTPSRSTCPAALVLSSTATATAPPTPPHDNGGRFVNAPSPPASHAESISTLEMMPSSLSFIHPPRTTRAPLTVHHAWRSRATTSEGRDPHCSVARSSRHTSLCSPESSSPPHITNPGRVPRYSFTPSRDALHTLISRRAPTKPLGSATRAHISTRARTCWAADQLLGAVCWAADLVLGAMLGS